MSTTSATTIYRRCATCGAVARQGAVYCPQCGTPISSATPPVKGITPAGPVATPKRSRGKYPWITLLFICCFFGVFHKHREPAASSSADGFSQTSPTQLGQSVPPDVLQAIQPSEEAQWDRGDVGLKIYNGSQWTITNLDVEIQIDHGYHSVSQIYRTSITTTPLQPLSSEYVTVHTALPRMYEGSIVKYRVVGAMGTRPG